MLEVENLHVSYGAVPAVRGIDLEISRGEAVALLGRNGAGKSTTLRAVAGLLHPRRGRICFDGCDLRRVRIERRTSLGIALVPEGRGVFATLTVRENLALGAYHRRTWGRDLDSDLSRVVDVFPRLGERMNQAAGSLSGGEQQMLAVGRGLMSRPRLLLVDEPSLGLAPIVVEHLYAAFAALRADGIALLIVEQYIEVALGFADRAYVLEKGGVAVSGDAAQLAASPDVVEAYLSATPEEATA